MVKLNEGASSLAMHFKLCIPTLFSSNRPQHLRLSSMYSGVLDKSKICSLEVGHKPHREKQWKSCEEVDNNNLL